ncbi:MAG: DNA methyltransferase [Vulcanimicrobiota bacterium]
MLFQNWCNQLYIGDNLVILREYVDAESIDLIYLDPPFNKKADFNVLFREHSGETSTAQITAFEDTWRWGVEAEHAFEEMMDQSESKLRQLLSALLDYLGRSDAMAYLTMMAPRLVEMHRVLKARGSLFLHCDPTSSHYLKLLLDAIFGPQNFRNEIIWRRTNTHNDTKRFGQIHDTIFFYAKSDNCYFEPQKMPLPQAHVDERFKYRDEYGQYKLNDPCGPGPRYGDSGKPWKGFNPTERNRAWAPPRKVCERLGIDNSLPTRKKLDALLDAGYIKLPAKPGGIPMIKVYLEEDSDLGTPYQDIWAYQPYTKGYYYGDLEHGIDEDVSWLGPTSGERLGYPTQKPLGLLARIITSACPPEGIVLDPFCGCGTAVAAAEHLERRWIGIDITHLAVSLIRHRIEEAFPDSLAPYKVLGEPKDLESAKVLAAEDRYQFQWWALGLVGAKVTRDQQKKGADQGIDGRGFFKEPGTGDDKAIVYSVKSGKVTSRDVRDLRGVIERENKRGKTPIGVLITLQEPSKPMVKEAASAGFYTPVGNDRYPTLQILTVADLLSGKEVQAPLKLPRWSKKPPLQVKAPRHQQGRLFSEG